MKTILRHRSRTWMTSIICGLVLVLATPGAMATSLEELEQRILELEQQLDAYKEILQEQKAAHQAQQAQQAEMAAEMKAEIANTQQVAEKAAEAAGSKEGRTKFTFGGYVKADTILSDFSGGPVASNSIGRDFYVPGTVPVGDNSQTYLDFHAKETRFNFKTETPLDNGETVTTFIELDFLVTPNGNERVSNSYTPRMRHAFVKYDNWLAGQTWSTFQDVSALAENLDFVGPAEGTVFNRQPMLRYTSGPWEFAVENPETTVTPFGGGGRVAAGDSNVPDFIGRYTHNFDGGYFKVAGIFRKLNCDNCIAGVDDSTNGYGISGSTKFTVGERDDLRFMLTYGSGLGRYVGLNTANGAVVDANGGLEAIDSISGFVSYRHFWSDRWRSNFTLSAFDADNDVALTGLGVTNKAWSVHANLLYEARKNLLIGGEYLYANREVESGADGDLNRLQFSVKYGFNFTF